MYLSLFLVPLLPFLPLISAEAKTPGIYPLRPWTRTAPNGAKAVVTPIVVEGITLSPRPPVVTATIAHPWISLKPNGAPVTIKPKIKKYGFVERASPTYGTWFPEETGAMAVEKEDGTEAVQKLPTVMGGKYYKGEFERLNPVIRCTPERYLDQGNMAPFCSPKSLTELQASHAYFVTWYPHYFNDTKVRINLLDYDVLSFESPTSNDPEAEARNMKESAFYTSEWIDNELGYYVLEVDNKWIGKHFSKSVYIQIESPKEAMEDLDVQNVPLVKFLKGPKAIKDDKARYDNQTWEMAVGVPLGVFAFIGLIVAFHFCTRSSRRIGKFSIGGHRGRLRRTRKQRRGYEKLEEGGPSKDAEITTVG
ncbi:hypothetical protein V1512DRAFT_263233 [Lipomyces arxii]|uniref:uncharacterized protein n=1 Tax=Lipomyces arxii TaxID=56418 RepID=UPI0034CD69E0